MKAAVANEPGNEEVLQYQEAPDPACGDGQVRIRVRAAAINRGDLGRRAGRSAGAQLSWPLIIGWDIAGEIESVGSGVADRKVGDRVVALIPQGGYAELATAPAGDTVPLPDNVSFDEGAALPVAYLTARYALLWRAGLQAGETVLIQAGASGVGVGAIQMAKNQGATVITTAGSGEKVEFCKGLGADHVINYRDQDFAQEVRRITNDAGVDVVLESVGGETLAKSMDVLGQFGRLVSVGNTVRETATMDVTAFLAKRCHLEGFSLLVQDDIPAELADLVQEVSDGSIKAVIDKVFSLSEAAEAHRYVAERRNMGKVILRP